MPYTVRLESLPPSTLAARTEWVLKSDYGCEGAEVVIGADVSATAWDDALAHARRGRWIAQRYFAARRDDDGRCANVGVYVVGGEASGFFSRLHRGATDWSGYYGGHSHRMAGDSWVNVTSARAGGANRSASPAGLAVPPVGTMGLWGALSLAGGCATTWGSGQPDQTELAESRDEVDVNVDALRLQRDEGWDVGQPGATLAFPDSTTEDAAGGQGWREAMSDLAGRLAPAAAALQPFYVPTLFQSLMGPFGQRLRAVMRPIHTADMEIDFARGMALRAQFAGANWPKDTALVVDAAGPRAVAVAAALADHFAPLFTFGNWPHPLGVVPAHQTIAASLYYLPMFSAAAAVRAADAPPLFVLDANRLAHYGDADQQFDNRYFVHLPPGGGAGRARHQARALRLRCGAGARRSQRRARRAGAKRASTSRWSRSTTSCAPTTSRLMVREEDEGDEGEESEDDPADVEGDPAWTWSFAWGLPAYRWPHYWYRGCWWDNALFWSEYAWYPPPHGRPRFLSRGRGAVVVGPPIVHRPPALPTRAAWRPALRNTLFTPVAASNARFGPTFGQVAVRAARSDGHIVGLRAGSARVPRRRRSHGQRRLWQLRTRRVPLGRQQRSRRQRCGADARARSAAPASAASAAADDRFGRERYLAITAAGGSTKMSVRGRPTKARRNRQPERVERRRRGVHRRQRLGDDEVLAHAGTAGDPRDLAIDLLGARVHAVVPAVVGADDDERVVDEPRLLQRLVDDAEAAIAVGDGVLLRRRHPALGVAELVGIGEVHERQRRLLASSGRRPPLPPPSCSSSRGARTCRRCPAARCGAAWSCR